MGKTSFACLQFVKFEASLGPTQTLLPPGNISQQLASICFPRVTIYIYRLKCASLITGLKYGKMMHWELCWHVLGFRRRKYSDNIG